MIWVAEAAVFAANASTFLLNAACVCNTVAIPTFSETVLLDFSISSFFQCFAMVLLDFSIIPLCYPSASNAHPVAPSTIPTVAPHKRFCSFLPWFSFRASTP